MAASPNPAALSWIALGPSPHLTWQELACWDRRVPKPWPLLAVYPLDYRDRFGWRLGEIHERIRAACGDRPIVVGSGYRTTAYNRLPEVGGVPGSYHTLGRAFDLYPPQGMLPRTFYDLIRSTVPVEWLRELKFYPAWGVHLAIARPESSVLAIRYTTSERPEAEVAP